MTQKRERIHITEAFDPECLEQLKARPHVTVTQGPFASIEKPEDVTILIIRSKTTIDQTRLTRLPQLRLVISCTAGFDHINLGDLKQFPSLTVTHTPRANTQSATELTWALILSLHHHLPQAHASLSKGIWQREPFLGAEVAEQTLGIVGLGRVGQRVANIAQGFGMKVVAYDPYQSFDLFQRFGVQRVGYHELLVQSDIISFHVPKTRETIKMLHVRHLESLSHGVTLINTSRGEVIDPAVIEQGLRLGYLRGVGLDVHYREPVPPDTFYLNHPRCIVTPHIGGWTREAIRKASQEALNKIEAFWRGQPLDDTLPPSAPWYTDPMGFVDPL